MYALGITALSAALLLASPADAFFKLVCPGRLVDERADPVISPGVVSGHVHQITGGSGFGFSMTYEQARAATCTSCPVSQDLSNYWTPVLYFLAQNGSFIQVPEFNDSPGQPVGMNAYYLQRPGPNNDTLKAFPEGFRMAAGDPFKRNSTSDFASQAVSFVCLDYASTSPQTAGMPTTDCVDGLRAQVFFPSCWDGVNLQSPTQSHVAYPESGSYDNGPCPATHPVHLVSLFYEVTFDVHQFVNDRWNDQPFVWSMGDPTGYGFHGDFFNGWDVDILQEAIDTCNDDSGLVSDCPVFDTITNSVAESQWCQIPAQVDEDIKGPLAALPGCNPVTDGPGEASPVTDCAVTPIGNVETNYVDLTTSLKYAYVGCGNDSVENPVRALTGAEDTSADAMTVETCVKYCSGSGYTYAGLEYSTQCFCGNELASTGEPVAGLLGICGMPCSGDSSEICGGYGALSIYKACGSGACTNAVWKAVGNSTASTGNSTVAASSAVSVVSSAASSAASAVSSAASAGSSAAASVASSAASSAGSSAATTATSTAAEETALSAYDSSAAISSIATKAVAQAANASAKSTVTIKTSSHVVSTVSNAATSSCTSDVDVVYVTVTDYITVTKESAPVSTATAANKRGRKEHHHGRRHDF